VAKSILAITRHDFSLHFDYTFIAVFYLCLFLPHFLSVSAFPIDAELISLMTLAHAYRSA